MEISATITVRNHQSKPHTSVLPRGLVLEAASTDYGVQNIVLLNDYPVTVPANGVATVRVIGRCLNRSRNVPSGNPGRVTPFKYAGIDFSQDAIWNRVGQPMFI